jgi:hypothetical protein
MNNIKRFAKEFADLMDKYNVDVSRHELGETLVIVDRATNEKEEFPLGIYFDTGFKMDNNSDDEEGFV